MKIECTARIFEKRIDEAGKLSIRCGESKKDQGGQWVSVSSFWATVRGSAVDFINALDISQGRKPLVILKGYLEGYGIKLPDGSYGRGYFSVVEASNPPFLANNQSAPANAVPAPAAMPVNTAPAPAAPVAPQPMPAAPAPAPQPAPVGQPVAAPNVTSFESQPSVTTNPFLKIS